MVDILSAVVGVAGGIAAGGVVTYLVFYPRTRAPPPAPAPRMPEGRPTSDTVTSADLEKSKRDMRTIMVERDLMSSALMKLYEAENEGRITREERELISKRYSEQIKDLQSKLKDVELVVEVGELEGLRKELVTLFQDKIQNIEGRLDSARQRLGVTAPPPPKEGAPEVEKGTELERVVEKRSKPEMSESEKRVKEIRDEVMEALTRLEQIDIEKKQPEN